MTGRCSTRCDHDSPVRRWQIGDAAQCACPGWQAPGACVVVSGGRRAPTVERGGSAHTCTTATPVLMRPGRPRTPRLPRIDPAVVRAIEARAHLIHSTPAALVEHVLRRWLDGRGVVSVTGPAEELTTQQAADLLNVSLEYLVCLLDEGKIAYTRTGAHRRVRIDHVLAFKDVRDRELDKSLDELTRLTEEFGGYDEEMKP